MKLKLLIISFLFSVSPHFSITANTDVHYPDGFADMFIESYQQISLHFYGMERVRGIDSYVTFDGVRVESPQAQMLIADALETHSLKSSVIQQIISELAQGVSNTFECQGMIGDCVLTPTSTAYLFDFDAGELLVFVAPDSFNAEDIEKNYADSLLDVKTGALINHTRTSFSSGGDGNQSFFITNETTLGLPRGFMSAKTDYKIHDDSQFTVDELYYQLNIESVEAKMGRFEYGVEFNSTDFLNNGLSQLQQEGVFIGSSNKLLLGGTSASQSLTVFAPTPGELQILRGDSIIYRKIVDVGQQQINYNELPTGVYRVTIKVISAGREYLSETRSIVNSNRYALPVKGWDYVLGLSQMRKFGHDVSALQSEPLGQGLISYRSSEKTLLGLGATVGAEEQYLQLGVRHQYDSNQFVEVNAGVLSDDAQFVRGYMGWGDFGLEYRQLTGDTSDSELAGFLFSSEAFKDLNITYSAPLSGGNVYVRGVWRLESETSSSAEREYYSGSLGYNFPSFWSSTFDVNVEYGDWGEGEELFTSVTWRLPIGKGVENRLSSTFIGGKHSRTSETLATSWGHGRHRGSLAAAAHLSGDERNSSYDLTGTYNGAMDWGYLDGYAYVDERGHVSGSLGYSGTQIISANGVDFTKDKARSFAIVDQGTNTVLDSDDIARVRLYNNARLTRTQSMVANTSLLLPMPEYVEANVSIDSDYSGINNVGDVSASMFSQPGHVMVLNTDFFMPESYIAVLDNLQGQAVENIQCYGHACLGIEKLSIEGAFRVHYKSDKSKQLFADGALCLMEDSIENNVKRGICLPGLMAEQLIPFDIHDTNPSPIFVGKYTEIQLATLLAQLARMGISPTVKTINDVRYVYIDPASLLSEQKKELSKMNVFTVSTEKNIDAIVSAMEMK